MPARAGSERHLGRRRAGRAPPRGRLPGPPGATLAPGPGVGPGTIARLASGGQHSAASLDWLALSYAHTAALRTRLAELYAPATGNRHLAALRGVLRECWRLGYLGADQYQRIADLEA